MRRLLSVNVDNQTEEDSSSKLGLPTRTARSFARSKSYNLDEKMRETRSAKGNRLQDKSSEGFQFNVSISDDRAASRKLSENGLRI